MKPHERLRRGDQEAWDRETQGLRPLRHTGRTNSVARPGDAPSDRNDNRRELGRDEAWIEFTRDVAPLGKRSPADQPANILSGEGESDPGNSGPAVAMRQPQSSGNAAPGTYSLDRRTLDRLKRGRIEPEARLDLHGKRYADAMQAVVELPGAAASPGEPPCPCHHRPRRGTARGCSARRRPVCRLGQAGGWSPPARFSALGSRRRSGQYRHPLPAGTCPPWRERRLLRVSAKAAVARGGIPSRNTGSASARRPPEDATRGRATSF